MSKKITIIVKNKEINALENYLTTEYKCKKKKRKDYLLVLAIYGKLVVQYDKDLK